jgi:hypothetical protein
MNPILQQAFEQGVQRYYPCNGSKLIISIYQSFVLYYIEDQPDSTQLEFIQLRPDNLEAFEFNGVLIPLALSLPYNTK